MSQLYCDDPTWNIYDQNGKYRIHKNNSLFGYKAMNTDMTCVHRKIRNRKNLCY